VIFAVQSVLDQTFSGFEIIVVDDGSTDGTFEELNRLFSGEERFRIVRQPNLERGAARNRGFRESRGKYVVFLDSDDQFLPDHLDTLHGKIVELNSPEFISTKYELLRNEQSSPSSIKELREDYYDYRLFLLGNPLAANVCVKRGMEQFVPFEEDRRYAIYEDWFFFLENLREKKIFIVDKVTLIMHDHDARSMRSDHQLIIRKAVDALDWIVKKKLLRSNELRMARGHVFFLCAVHSYLDGRAGQATKFIGQSVKYSGIHRKHVILLLKLIPGHARLQRLKKATQAG